MATLTYEPTSPVAGGSLTFYVKGAVQNLSKIILTSSGDEVEASPQFTQGDVPEGTGVNGIALDIHGGTSGTFVLTVLTPDGVSHATTPIYYYNDAPTYAYPDSAGVISALQAAVSGMSVSASRVGAVTTLLLGGDYSGKETTITLGSNTIGGSPVATVTEVKNTGGPFTWGPVTLKANTYVANVREVTGNASVLAAPVSITVT